MRVWTVSDLHVDYKENANFVQQIGIGPYINDILIVPGDITHDFSLLKKNLLLLKERFANVLFIPGNHDLWIHKDDFSDSIEKFQAIQSFCQLEEIKSSYVSETLDIIPFYAWYDFSFGIPNSQIQRAWKDFKRCKWPFDFDQVNPYFTKLNEPWLQDKTTPSKIRISYSHFLPFAELIPSGVPELVQSLIPVMGSMELGKQIKNYQPNLHIYGHSHLNRKTFVRNIRCLNNAYAYPREVHISRKRMLCIFDGELLM